MRKPRDDSTWSQLTAAQRETLEGWLFEENLGYDETLKRVHQEFGLKATVSSLGRYYRHRVKALQIEELVEAQMVAIVVNKLPVDTDSLRAAALKLVAKAVIRLVSEHPDRVDQVAALTRLLLDSEDNELRRARLKLAEKQFDYEATAATIPEMPRMRACLELISEDESLSPDEKQARVQALLYGMRPSASSRIWPRPPRKAA